MTELGKLLSEALANFACMSRDDQDRFRESLQHISATAVKPPPVERPVPLSPVEKPKRASNRCVRWSDEDTQKVKDFLEDPTIMSDRSRRQAKRALCRELGRTEDGIKQKIFQILKQGTEQQ